MSKQPSAGRLKVLLNREAIAPLDDSEAERAAHSLGEQEESGERRNGLFRVTQRHSSYSEILKALSPTELRKDLNGERRGGGGDPVLLPDSLAQVPSLPRLAENLGSAYQAPLLCFLFCF